jgi:hypothetical protein
MTDLEHRLAALATEIDWPGTPELSSRVTARLTEPARRVRPAWSRPSAGRRWALAAAAMILAAAALVAYSPSREAIAGWLNLHTIFQRVTHLATPSPQPSGPLGTRLGLGRQTTLDQARRQVAWQVAVPSSLGAPDEVYLQDPPDGPPEGEVTLVYKARPGIPVASQTGVAVLVTEARGAVDQNFFGKMLGPDTTIEPVTVSGHDGWWISGAPHVFFFTDSGGNFRSETLRLATNTLLLDDGETVIRIEGNLTKAQVLEIAASLG